MMPSRRLPLRALLLLALLGENLLAHPEHPSPETSFDTEPGQALILAPLPPGRPEALNVVLRKEGVRHELVLRQHSVRGPNFRVVAADSVTGELREIPAPPISTYIGTVKGDAGSDVSAVLLPEGLRARVSCSDGTCFRIEPPVDTHSGYEWKPVSLREQFEELGDLAALAADPALFFGTLALPRSVTVRQAEIGFDIDYPTWSRSGSGGFNGSDAAALAKMEEFVQMKLNNFVLSNALVEHVLGLVILRKSTAEDPYNGMTDAYAILPKMRDVWNALPANLRTHDLAHGLIGRGIGVAGLGYVGTIGTSSRYSIGVTTSGSGVGFWFNGVAKHEIAHNWSLGHGGCGDETRPIGDDFTWSMCDGYHDRMRSDEAASVVGHRDSHANVLADIGPYTASNQAPYCPKDTAVARVAGPAILIDVLRNDYDANNNPFQIESLTVGTTVTSTTSLGGQIALSAGSGPGGRDQVLYTPPTTGTPGAVDKFYYNVRDFYNGSNGRGSFGQVKVTLEADIKPKDINPASYLADTSLQFSGAQNPHGDWRYGSFSGASTVFKIATAMQFDGANVVGPENAGWIGDGAMRVHKLAMVPGDAYRAVRRWTSTHEGEVAILYDAKRLETTGTGQRASILRNGTEIWGSTLTPANSHANGTVFVTIAIGDTLDFVVDSLGSRTGDWLHFTGRVLRADQVKWRDSGGPALHYKLDAHSLYPPVRLKVAADASGQNRHASLTNINPTNARIATEIEHGIFFDGLDDQIETPQPAALQGVTEMSFSAWVNPKTLGENRGILTSLNTTDQNTSYFGFLVGAAADGLPAQFRAHRASVNAPTGSLPLGKWTHLAGVWKSGQVQKLYVNRIEVGSNASPPSGPMDTNRWITGRDREQANRFFDGGIDDVVLWSRALSLSEIDALYQQGRDSLNYNGTSDFQQSNSPLYGQGATEITIAAWVRAASLGDNRGILTSYNSDDINRSFFGLLIGGSADGRPAQFRAHRQLVNALPGSFPVGEWAHITGVWKSGVEQSLYIDGTKVAENPNPPSGPIDIESWITGRDRLIAGRFFEGDIGEPLILARALDATEIAALYGQGRTNFSATAGFLEHSGDIGVPTSPGTLSEASGVLTSTTRGTAVGGTADNFHFASRAHSGDGEITVKLEALTATGSGSKAGLMFRDGRAANAPFVALWQYGDGRLAMRHRATGGATALSTTPLVQSPVYPLWLRLSRKGDAFTGTWSTDGENFTFLDSLTVPLASSLQSGILHQSNTSSLRSIASFSQLTLGPVTTLIDSDDDGLNDAWELARLGNLLSGPNDDNDRDGLSNLLERFAGTDPLRPDRLTQSASVATFSATPVPFGSVWRFLDNGTDQGTAWRAPAFNDTAWAAGPAPLGYGEPDIATPVSFGPSATNVFVTTYFRHRFQITNPDHYAAVGLSVRRDDGVALYLNGTEIGRDNLAAGALFNTYATTAIGGADESTPVIIPFATSALVPGENTLAVEIHQSTANSSDVAFNLELAGLLPEGVSDGTFLTLRLARATASAGEFIVTSESSSDLATWTTLPHPPRLVSDDGTTQILEAIDTVPSSPGSPRQLRVRVTAR